MQFNLSKQEFCLFSDQTKTELLNKYGKLISVRKLNERIEVKLYSLFDFIVHTTFEKVTENYLTIQLFHGTSQYFEFLKSNEH